MNNFLGRLDISKAGKLEVSVRAPLIMSVYHRPAQVDPEDQVFIGRFG